MTRTAGRQLAVVGLICACSASVSNAFSASVGGSAGPLWIDFGAPNSAEGLAVPSTSDGANVPAGPVDAYLTVEYFDDEFSGIQVQYDGFSEKGDRVGHYVRAEDFFVALGSGAWRRATARLPGLCASEMWDKRGNLRLERKGLAVRRVEVAFTRPAEYIEGGFDPRSLGAVRVHAGPGVEVVTGVGKTVEPPNRLNLMRTLGATSAETYVTWQTVEDAGEGEWDWSQWDGQVENLRKTGMRWAPALMCGPAYTLPRWFRESERSVPFVCLEHGEPSKIQSLWDPNWRPWVERFLKAFAQRYGDSGILESIKLGISGLYGEALYPSGPETGPFYDLSGPFHNHRGWWAGDPFAAGDFRRFARERYGGVAALNRAWRTNSASFDEVAPFLPDQAPSPRARLDFVEWYERSMTDLAVFWVSTLRKHLPQTQLYLDIGGRGEPEEGADFSALVKAIAPYGAGVWITNEDGNFAGNFSRTGEAATACRAFGVNLSDECAKGVDAEGNVARIANAAEAGARQFFSYDANLMYPPGALRLFHDNIPFFRLREPIIYAGLYLPKTSWMLDAKGLMRVLKAAAALRDRANLQMVDRLTLGELALRDMRVLLIAEAPYAELAEIEALKQWVARGGILIALSSQEQPLLRTPEGDDGPVAALFVNPPPNAQGPLVRSLFDEDAALRRLTTRIGQGATLLLPGGGVHALGEALDQAATHPERLAPGHEGVALPASDGDGVFATATDSGTVYYNSNAEPRRFGATAVPARGIAVSP
ncbi:MAG: beta-galactosidase [Candidatus Sumerlaeota bacterium]|nr:beta-galactosidase [Candidatus Sumerlaeota bacterium]